MNEAKQLGSRPVRTQEPRLFAGTQRATVTVSVY